MSGLELATGYVSLVTDASQIAKEIDKALAQGSRNVDKVGQSIGSKLGGAIEKTLKASAVTAGAAVATVVGTSLTKGWQRLTAIDDAKGKLTSLGHTAMSTSTIMDSALASVKGTSYGLGDAANIAASAVAAGVKPGQDLTRYLSLTADAASIAGVSLQEMGQIVNKVQTGGTAYTMEITQLADRGIPIWQWLAKEMNVTQSQLKKLVSEGKVDSATYFAAIEKNIGGAATAATTVSSAWSNTMAALGRGGAAALEPTFGRLTGWLSTATSAIDAATPKIKEFFEVADHKVFNEWGPQLTEFGTSVRDAFDEFRHSGEVLNHVDQIKRVFFELVDVGEDLVSSGGSIAASLARASAATGVGTWQLLLTTLEAVAPILNATLVPALELTAGLMESNQWAVTGLVLGFAAFKTVPGLLTAIVPSMAKLQTTAAATAAGTVAAGQGLNRYQQILLGTHNAATRTTGGLRSFGQEVRLTQSYAQAAGRPIGSLSAGILTLHDRATGANGALSRMRSGLSNVSAALGGPVGIGVGAALIAVPQLISAAQNWDSQARISREATNELTESQKKMARAFAESSGAVNDSVLTESTKQAQTLMNELSKLEDDSPGWWKKRIAGFSDVGNILRGRGTPNADAVLQQEDRSDAAGRTLAGLKDLGVGADEFGRALAGTQAEWSRFYDSVLSSGQVTSDVATEWMLARTRVEQLQEASKRVTPGIYGIVEGFKTLADTASTASQKSSALKRTLDLLAGVPVELGDAMEAYNDAIKSARESVEEPWDPSKGMGAALIKTNGLVDTSVENGKRARAVIQGLKDTTADYIAKGGDVGETLAKNDEQFQALARSLQWTDEQLQQVLRAEGYLPEVIELTARLNGADDVTVNLGSIKAILDNLKPGEPKVIPLELLGPGVQKQLEDWGFGVEKLKDGANVAVTADNPAAMAKLNEFIAKAVEINEFKASAEIDLKTDKFDLNARQSQIVLDTLAQVQALPGVDLNLDDFRGKQSITIEELNELSKKTAKPEIILQMAKALEDAREFGRQADYAARPRTATLTFVETRAEALANQGLPQNFIGPVAQRTGADGGILGNRDSDPLALMRKYAFGGIQNLPGNATIQPGRGAGLVQWAEGETGGEAFIPLALSKRGRSMQILADVAQRFGMRLESFANGGVREAIDAVRGVEGNQYLWGGTGPLRFDCSGLVGWVQQILMGFGKETSRIYTTYSLIAGQTAGLVRGLNSASPFNVGVSDEHMAATLDGQAVESGGAHGTSGIGGGRARAEDSQFPYKFHLPLSLIAGGLDSRTDAGYSSYYSPSRPVWTEEDDFDLREARISLAQAIESRDEALKSDKKSPADRDSANLRVERAERKVRELEAKRDGTGTASTIVTPAPELMGQMDEDAIALRRAELGVLDAQLARDKAYSEVGATGSDKEKADLAVYDANNALAATRRRLSGGDGPRIKSAKEVGQDLVGILIDGVFDELGLSDSVFADPSRLTEPDTSVTGGYTTREMPKSGGDVFRPAPMFPSPADLFSQLPFTPGHQTAEETARLFDGSYGPVPAGVNLPWLDSVMATDGGRAFEEMLRRNPFDSGGRASGIGLLPKAILKPERVLEPRTTENFERLTAAVDSGALLERLEMPAGTGGGGGNTFAPVFQGTDNQQMFAMFERWFRAIQRGGGQQTRARTSRRR
ncbi:tape measure protein [Rhodococcus hoagii]|nr:tape measure protein [Prescottella equi]MBM4650989.1 tape measure protein [Prescottella equi]MBM4686664.1 tape measure protein [Prescottella equi]